MADSLTAPSSSNSKNTYFYHFPGSSGGNSKRIAVSLYLTQLADLTLLEGLTFSLSTPTFTDILFGNIHFLALSVCKYRIHLCDMASCGGLLV